MSILKIFIFPVILIFLFPTFGHSDATVPLKDLRGSHDPVFLKRFEGSLIVAYKHRPYDKFTFPLSPLRPTGKEVGDIELWAPEKSKTIEGEHTRLAYLIPKGHSPYEVMANYELHLKDIGGKVLYSCQGKGCGANPHHASWIWYGNISLAYFLEDMDSVSTYNKKFSTGYCALASSSIRDQHFLVAEIPNKNSYISILTYTLGEDSGCERIKDKTVAVVDLVVQKDIEEKMVVVKAEKMAKDIKEKGSVALYGIYFDSGKAEIKPESKPTLEQIAKLLKQNPSLKLLVVGHTDNQGTFSYNMDLSKRRANSVIAALKNNYGINSKRLRAVGVGYACPRASNLTPKGRAKNRRVELVSDNK